MTEKDNIDIAGDGMNNEILLLVKIGDKFLVEGWKLEDAKDAIDMIPIKLAATIDKFSISARF